MPWSSLRNRIDSLPLVLAGPILRRTEPHSVTVWLALKAAVNGITLTIKDGATTIMTGTANTFQLGEKLFVVVVTASEVTSILKAGKIYHYDINFPNYGNLEALGVITNDAGLTLKDRRQFLCYGDEPLPSFCMPPDGETLNPAQTLPDGTPVANDLNNLKLVHGSCRKPHGGKSDGLTALERIIGDNINQPFLRPQQLFLTGDQIYADDVADVLLYMLDDASKTLLGWVEDLPEPPLQTDDKGNLLPPIPAAELTDHLLPPIIWPGDRESIITRAELTAFASGKSHLMRLGEFYCMYLFAWSNNLWPLDIDGFPAVVGDNTQLYSLNKAKVEYRSRERDSIFIYRQGLYQVRRALANVPTYMMCDDHEITDDWFISLDWCQRILGDDNDTPTPPHAQGGDTIIANPLGQRIVQNGLTAFAIFQAWGNNPESFSSASGPEKELLDALNKLNIPATRNDATFDLIKTKVLPTIGTEIVSEEIISGLGLYQNYAEKKLISPIKWNFYINYPLHQVILLNTRTERAFPRIRAPRLLASYKAKFLPASLLSEEAIERQVPALSTRPASAKVSIVVSPTPVIGHVFIEEILQPAVRQIGNFRHDLTYYSFEHGSSLVDSEAWSFSRSIFEKLLDRLSYLQHVVILSGDVHYAFSAGVKYWNNRNLNVPVNACFAQLTSSSFKNQTLGTRITALTSVAAKYLNLWQRDFLGWNLPGNHLEDVTPIGNRSVNVSGVPAVEEVRYKNEPPFEPYLSVRNGHEPNWQYRIEFQEDNRPESLRNTYVSADLIDPVIITPRPVDSNLYLLWLTNLYADEASRRASWSASRLLVGFDNMSQVSFNWSETDKKVFHTFWYNPQTNPEVLSSYLKPYTVHEIALNAPLASEKRPGDR